MEKYFRKILYEEKLKEIIIFISETETVCVSVGYVRHMYVWLRTCVYMCVY